ncbi:MAG: response regulator transcription factor [Acidobacteria bacterium]|nr:response regulator transcription factor [Acidobacteriota bacterium]
MRVLIVEDSPEVASRISEAISHIEGSAVLGMVESAPEAISGIAALRPDVVVLDLGLAEGSGYDVLKACRSLAGRPVVLVFSNHLDESVDAYCLQLGATRCFDKTHQLPDLLEFLRAWVRTGMIAPQ